MRSASAYYLTSFFRLMRVHFQVLRQGRTTDDAEFRLALAELARVYERFRIRRRRSGVSKP